MSDSKKDDFSEVVENIKKRNFKMAKRILSRLEKTEVGDHAQDYFFYLKALTSMRLDEKPAAKKYFQQLLEKKPNTFFYCQANLLLGYLYTTEENYQQAEEHLHLLLKSNYENPQIYSVLGYIYHMQGDFPQAEYYYAKSLNLDPDNPNSNNSMGIQLPPVGRGKTQRCLFLS